MKQFTILLAFFLLGNSSFAQTTFPSSDRPTVVTKPLSPDSLYNSGVDKFTRLKDYKGAIMDYSKAIQITPRSGEYLIARGMAKSHRD